MFNLKKEHSNKYAMAIGARAVMGGNFSAGALKFRLVQISDSMPNIQKIKDSINDTYSADGGNLYFLFAAENTYSKPREVNDKNTLNRMMEERKVREEFTKAIYLRDISDLNPTEEAIYISQSGIISKIVDYSLKDFIAHGHTKENIEKMRKIRLDEINNELTKLKDDKENSVKISDLKFLIALFYEENPEETKEIFEPLVTDDIEKAAAFRIKIDKNKLGNAGIALEDDSPEKIRELYLLYNKSASYHPEVSNRGEINLLDESIERLSQIISGETDNEYDVNQYIESKIEEIDDNEHRENMEDAWELFKSIRFPLQNPSWVAIGWPQKGADEVPLQGINYGDNLKIPNLVDLTFCDPETDQKYIWHKEVGYVTIGNKPPKGTTRALPTTPQSTLIEIIGKKPSSTRQIKIIESLVSKINEKRKELGKASTDAKYKEKLQEINNLIKYFSWHMKIRNNLNAFDHRDKRSYFYLYDEICNLYFQYNRERYGDGIMLKSSAFRDEGNRKIIGRNPFNTAYQPYRPFIPTALHDDLREVIISVHYAYGTNFPHFARTSLPKNTNFSEELLSRIIQKASQEGITKLTVANDKITEEIIVDPAALQDFFSKLAHGGVLVQRVEESQTEDSSNIIWYTGMRSFTERYDRKNVTIRTVLDDDGELMEYFGYGRPRVSSGDVSNSKNFDDELQKMSLKGVNKGSVSISNKDGSYSVYVGPTLEDVYEYAEKYYGLDYGIDKIRSMSAKKIKPIPQNIFKELTVGISEAAKKEIQKMQNSPEPEDRKVVIPIKTQEQINKWIEEVNKEISTETKKVISPKPEIQQIQQPLNAPEIQPQPAAVTVPPTTYQPTQSDYAELEHLKSIKTMMGGRIPLEQNNVEDLKRKGYIITPIEGNEYVIEDPPWSKVTIK